MEINLSDFNVEMSNSYLSNCCALNNLKNFIKETTCYKNPDKPACIDYILINCPRCFQYSSLFETGLSYFHN